MEENKEYMNEAIRVAKQSGIDIPVGAIIVKDGKIIAAAHNEKELLNDTTCHAEILAIKHASQCIDNWRLDGCDLYVTLEPCPMCAWAIINARIQNVFFALSDTLYGAFGGKIDLREISTFKPNVIAGILEDEAKIILSEYMKEMRKKYDND